MPEYVYRKFPNYIKTLQALLQKDATFREICADYEEMCTWLDLQYRSEDRSNNECDIAREVIRELEDEITEVLKSTGF
jgi:uncharacterized protein YdcH (DUF465 family)